MNKKQTTTEASVTSADKPAKPAPQPEGQKSSIDTEPKPKETGGPKGPEPTRYGDWEQKGRCSDF